MLVNNASFECQVYT